MPTVRLNSFLFRRLLFRLLRLGLRGFYDLLLALLRKGLLDGLFLAPWTDRRHYLVAQSLGCGESSVGYLFLTGP
jgi:hypothetical protein